jgi:Translation initiation factor IF-2, N-terminal region
MENEYMKRGYLLPEGCKDLTDVPKYKARPSLTTRAPLPPITGEMIIPAQMTVSELAAALSQKPFRIIADLIELGIFVTIKHQLDFDLISRVVRKYGFAAKQAV